MMAGVLAASCAQPTPVVVEKQVPVEKVVKETVVVQKEVAVEKVVTATPVTMKYKEAPMLAGLVREGKLPPVDERLPPSPMVITPWEEIGQYGGTWHRLSTSPDDIRIPDRLVYEFLIRWNKDATETYPNVLEKWEANADFTEWTFTMRKGIRWSDGEPYTSADLAYYFEDILTDTDLTPTYPYYFKVNDTPAQFTRVDDQVYKLTFVAPYPSLGLALAGSDPREHSMHPKHYASQFHRKYVDAAKLAAMTKEAGFEFWYQLYGNKCRGGAAFKNNLDFPVINAWRVVVPPPKMPTVLERNPYYWKVDPEGNQLPYIDRMEHMVVQGADQVNLRAVAGEVDMQMRHLTFNNYPLFMESRQKGDYRILLWTKGYASDAVLYINFWAKDDVIRQLFNDKRFRYALSLGINRQEIIEGVYLGVTEPKQISPNEDSPFYWDEWANWMTEYDPDRANAYIDEIGLVNQRDSEGYRLRPDGKRLTIEFLWSPVFGSWGDIGTLYRAHWKQLGIDLTVNQVSRELRDERKDALDYELNVWTADGTTNPFTQTGLDWYTCREGMFESTVALWVDTKGKEGKEPTPEMLAATKLRDDFLAATSMDQWVSIFRKALEIQKEHLWVIAPCTASPEVVVVKNNFRNVPEDAVSDWQYMTPGNTMTEQYFIKQS